VTRAASPTKAAKPKAAKPKATKATAKPKASVNAKASKAPAKAKPKAPAKARATKAAAKPKRAYAGRTPEQRRDERVERLRAAGLELFGTAGYGGTRIQALCSEARVTARHFYELYPSTEALFRDVYDDISGGCLHSVAAALGARAPAAERIQRGALAAVTYLLTDTRRARVQCVESYTVSPAFQEHRDQVLQRYTELLAGVAAAQDLPLTPLQQHVSAAAMVAAADSVLAAHVRSPSTVSVDDCRACLTYLFSRVAGLS